ncbi:Eukaryotic translation initiation factor 3 subunit B [Trichinella pseudospiralis]|uniref:Eukaryotic translation initiation factor 3 subunit B n=2 Tax=Trichinella pseudospiralis TaxID=6337 RepID=A0A0V1KF84_TRIPS|nr:Eukaryotic translation initiation factor 3 subunit B [Trichinella pseudospiralis]KRY79322.1 Eukaryotic translation initiation factor 3 subunit B [Trichinella pseudospiralis]KRY93693.1 Eukaryotic translation initiation factor 3 subunit B [Trichinella pseudospiralis]KRZ34379.1 Eukaryotic translation initiation factor 3 subunit B [Trichinella pseudospiralis]KRZ45923.1 Eukaryotic translation initiation factor 3 subunit B [Trichinella pseudospiralis]
MAAGEHEDDPNKVLTDDGEEPSFSDPEDYVDRCTDEELIPDLLKAKPVDDDGSHFVIVVDNIPKVGPDRLPKLKAIMGKIFSKFGKVVEEYYPLSNNETKGYCFVEFGSKTNAEEAAVVLNGYKLDKNHTFIVNLENEFEKYNNPEPNFQKPVARPYKDNGNLKSWLLNEECIDQFVMQSGFADFKAGTYWNTFPEPTLICEKKNWSEANVQWSPQGTYLATVHSQGIALWGGKDFVRINRFCHPDVSHYDISPCEKYIITFSAPKYENFDSSNSVIVWEIFSGDKKRSFPLTPNMIRPWPYYKWSYDGKFLATLKDETLCIYETETFALLGKKTMPIEGIRDFEWSPTDDHLAYWVSERGHAPGRVALMKLPEKLDIRSKNMFNMAEATIYWQKCGDNLCFKVDRYAKKKEEKCGEIKYSGISHHLEVFHIREKEVPVTSLEVKENIQAFAWEPHGFKFAIIVGDLKTTVVFYGVRSNPVSVVQLRTLEQKNTVNAIYWAPTGHHVVFVGLKGASNGALVFVDTNVQDIIVANQQEHPGLTHVEWDPTGRYLVTSVSIWAPNRGGDCGYVMWNFQGRMLQKKSVEEFCMFSWRPRPKPLLSDSFIKYVKKNLKKYTAQFEERDRQVLLKASEEIISRRREMYEKFQTLLELRREEWFAEKSIRMKLRGDEDTDDLFGEENTFVEECEMFLSKEVILE